MKRIITTSLAMRKWLFMVCNILLLTPAFAQETVPAGTYVSFSTVYNGKRYYLGVDTVKAKAGTPVDTIMAYDNPNYATMWQLGEERGAGDSYLRTISSVWMKERTDHTRRFLAVGTDKGTYSPLVLRDTTQATLWTTANDEREVSKYIQVFLHYYSDATGVDVYRYVTYDPLYGFSRAFSTRPAVSQRMTAWDRKTGDDLRFDFWPETHTFGLEMERTTTILPLTAKVTFYENVDRFRSRDGRIDVFTKDPTVIDNQETLIGNPYYLTMYYEWASNPRTPEQHPTTLGELVADSYNGNSVMNYWTVVDTTKTDPEDPTTWSYRWGWKDTTLMNIRNFKFARNNDNTLWHDTLYTVGTSPFDRPESRFLRPESGEGSDPGEGMYLDHADWLYVHFTCKGLPYKDSALVIRQTFHNEPFTRLTSSVSPVDHVFPYKTTDLVESDTAATFTVTIRYVEGNRIIYASGNTERIVLGEEQVLDIASLPKVIVGGREYDTLKVEALMANGNSAIVGAEGADANAWIESVRLVSGNQIRVKVKPQPESSPEQRSAQLRFSYNYLHSYAAGDTVLTTRSIWITQKSAADGNAEIYAFHHKGTTTTPQQVHTKCQTLYAIPGTDLQLSLHRDHWGYYRWYEWDYRGGEYEKDVAHSNWEWITEPVNELEGEFMVINHVSDVSSRGRWDVLLNNNNHFIPGKSTVVPTIQYPESATKTDSIACDVSAYVDIDTTGIIGKSLTSLTEPTLSYRQIFDIHPAKEQADKMARCRVNGDEGYNKWMEEKVIIAPAKRSLTLAQQYPVSDKATSDVEDQLQYIYYFRPADSGTADPNMGVDPGSNYDKAATYARIGRKYKSGMTLRRAKLLTITDLEAMSTNDTKNVFVVNPRKENGYLFGGNSSQQKTYYTGVFKGRTDTADLRRHIEDDILNANVNYNNYKVTLTKTGTGTIKLTSATSGQELNAHKGLFGIGAGVDWGTTTLQANNSEIKYQAFSGTSEDDRITDIGNALLELQMSAAIIWAYDGSLTAYDGSTASLHLDKSSEGINKGWCFYQIIEPVTADHYETPRWYKKASGDSDWVCVANGDSTAAGYKMLENGNLQMDENVHKNANETIQYCLKTAHFQLAKFTLVTRSAETEGPSERAIIPVETMENDYDILFSLTIETGHLPWEQSEMSYHYPMSVIDGEHRIIVGDEPAKGEYAFMTSFRGIDAISGTGETDYLLCLNAAEKPVQFMNFEYPQLMCSDQQLYFTAELCNPIQNGYNPQITAEMEGYNGSSWEPIYRYVTGEVPYDNGKWYQLVMPIDQATISGYQKFRFKGYLNGSTENEAFVLLDHLRFIARVRPLSVFQNKTTCLEGGEIDIVARLDYQHATFEEGTLVAYQYQKLNTSTHTFEPLSATGEGAVTYINDSGDGTKTDTEDKACGVIRIPAANFDPSTGPSAAYVRPIGGVTSTIRSYVNEASPLDPYWTMYISQKISAAANDTFRVAMAVIPNASTAPNFATAGCATERILGVKNPVELRVDNKPWKNATKAEVEAADTLKTPNNTYRVKAILTDATLPTGSRAGSGTCKFDILRSTETVDYNTLIAAWQAAMRSGDEDQITTTKAAVDAADAEFLAKYGVNHSDLLDYLEIFRNPASPHAETTNWNDVNPLDFTYSGRTPEESREIYRVLDKLITKDHKLQIGVDYHDVFLGSDQDICFHLHPMPSSGRYIVAGTGKEEKIEVCNSPIWFEMHSGHADYQLRFGRDHIINGNYEVPIIRASKTDANEHLKVRLADITHSGATGVLIGWDSTQVVDSNDPEWLAGGESFRYHQDRIAQSDVFSQYYQIPEGEGAETDPRRFVIFRPVTAAYVDSLSLTTCPCYDYDPSGTVHGTSGDGHDLTQKEPSGCNPWGVLPRAKGVAGEGGKEAPHAMPGHRAANTMSLKAGYWYRFRTAFFNMSGTVAYNATDDIGINYAEFILAVAPDTVQWAPSHPESANYWNDDDNWIALNGAGDTIKDCIAPIPMSDSRVIIPAAEVENLLPLVVPDSALVARRVDTLDYGFEFNTCKEILFKPYARMLGQENLDYHRAFVDIPLISGGWQTYTSVLDHIYSGDFYAVEGADPDFAPATFPHREETTGLVDNPRMWPYAFYQAFYNMAVRVGFQNTDKEGNPLAHDTVKSQYSVDWIRTNILDMHYEPGLACVMDAYDASDEDGREIIVRLPKQEASYFAYGRNPEAPDDDHQFISGTEVPMGEYTSGGGFVARPAFNDLEHNLAYDKTAMGDKGYIEYTLHNAIESDIFFFGNPTLALIDVYKLCVRNASVLKHEDDTYHFTAYQLANGSTYTVKPITDEGQFYVMPQRAVGLIAATPSNELTIKLYPEDLVAMTGDGSMIHNALAPKRQNGDGDAFADRRLYIAATVETEDGPVKSYVTIGESFGASKGFRNGEDAQCLTSGKTNFSYSSFSTPLSMYTIADNQPMMLDIRDTIGAMPLVFTMLDEYYAYNNSMILSFATDGEWDKPLYLYDAITNDSILIMNGMRVEIETPLADQLRYFINGYPIAQSTEQQDIPTALETVNESTNDQMGNDHSAVIYDLLGRHIMTLNEYDLISDIHLPTGVYVIQRGTKTERMVIR